MFPVSGYESGKIEVFISNLKHYKHLDKAAYRYYVDANFNIFIYFFIPAVFISMYSIYKRKYSIIIFTFLFYVITYYTTCIYFYEWESNSYMNLYGRLSFLTLMPPVYILLKSKKNIFLLPFMLLITLLSIFQVKKYTQEYEIRFAYIQKILDSHPEKTKLYLPEDEVNFEKLWLSWATPYESIILSRLRGKCQTLYIDKKGTEEINNLDQYKIYSVIDEHEIKELTSTFFQDIKLEPYYIISDRFN